MTVTTADLMAYVPALLGGLLTGLLYYGGLWWTLQRLADTQHPGLLLGMSFLARTVIALAALFWFTDLQLPQILVFMVAFVIMRLVLTRRWGPNSRAAGRE